MKKEFAIQQLEKMGGRFPDGYDPELAETICLAAERPDIFSAFLKSEAARLERKSDSGKPDGKLDKSQLSPWKQLDESTLTDEERVYLAEMRECNRKAAEAKKAFEAAFKPRIAEAVAAAGNPIKAGTELRLSYNFGKISSARFEGKSAGKSAKGVHGLSDL